MQVLLIAIILTMLDLAVGLYQNNRNPNAAAETLGGEEARAISPRA